jgi:hypothetical protein
VFDTNAPINTPEWLNTLDNSKPESHVLPLPAAEASTSFKVDWSGSDAGAGIKDYTIFVSEDGGTYNPWLTDTVTTSGTFTGTFSKTYSFYSVARDLTGNIEDAPIGPDAMTQLIAQPVNQPPVADAGPDQTVNTAIKVTLNGSASRDPDNAPAPLTYRWTQTSGPTVVLTGDTTSSPTFTPTIIGTYIFTLTVSDGQASASDEVKINVVSNQSNTLKVTQLLLDKKLKSFFLLSNFTLGTGNNGINPVKEAVTFKIGNFTSTIPAGSFRKISTALFIYAGTINKVKMEVIITSLGSNRYAFQTAGTGVDFSGTTNPVKVDLSIGDDNGTTSVKAIIK